MDTSTPTFKSRRQHKGKGSAGEPDRPQGTRPSATAEGAPTLSPILMRHGPPLRKRPRSSALTNLPHVDEWYLRHNPPSTYWLTLFQNKYLEKCNEDKEEPTPISKETRVMMELFYQMHRDYRLAIDALVDNIEAVEEVVAELRTTPSRPDTPTPIPFLPTKEAPAPPAEPQTTLPLNPLQPAPAPSWATVARKRNKKTNITQAKPSQATAQPATMKPAQHKKGPTARERPLFIKKEAAPSKVPYWSLGMRSTELWLEHMSKLSPLRAIQSHLPPWNRREPPYLIVR